MGGAHDSRQPRRGAEAALVVRDARSGARARYTPSMTENDVAFLTQGPLARLRELQALLERRGIRAAVVPPPGGVGNT